VNGEILRSARQLLGLTQRELGHQVGISQQMVSDYERGEVTPTGARLVKLCAVLELDPTQFETQARRARSEHALERIAGALEQIAAKIR